MAKKVVQQKKKLQDKKRVVKGPKGKLKLEDIKMKPHSNITTGGKRAVVKKRNTFTITPKKKK